MTCMPQNGWTLNGGGRVSSKTSFNLLGGYIEFDMDTTKTNAAVNTNVYTTCVDAFGATSVIVDVVVRVKVLRIFLSFVDAFKLVRKPCANVFDI